MTTSLVCLGRALCASLLLSLLVSCGGGGDDDAAPANLIGPAGGTVTGPNGTQLVVPAGALSTPVAITITLAANATPVPAGQQTIGSIYAFGPAGTTFAVPVTVTLPLDPAQVPAGARLRMLHGDATTWVELPGLVVGATSASAQTTSFSDFGMTFGNSPPFITTQPVATSVVAPGPASFSVAFSGTPGFEVQWARSNDGGMTWVNATALQTVTTTPGSSSLLLATTNASPATAGGDNGALFRAAISNLETLPGMQVISNVVSLTVSAVAQTTADLTVTLVGNGSVSSAPAGISCGADCSETYALNTVVTLTATAAAGSTFSTWSADCPGGIATMAAARNCIATFTAIAAGTWQQLGGALDIVPANVSRYASVALDSTGNPVVAWLEEGPASSIATGIHVKRWDGSSWVQLGDDLTIYRNPTVRFFDPPSIDIDPTSGQPVVAWSESSDGNPVGFAYDVYVKRWTGSAWEQLGGTLNVDTAAGARFPKVRVTNTGTPFVAWWETPNWTAAKLWNGSAWISFGAQGFVSTVPTGASDFAETALTIDGSGNPFVVFGVSGGPFAAQGLGNGWTLLGNGSPRTSPAAAFAWSAATDVLGRLTVLFTTRDSTSTAADATTVRIRRIENGAWTDFGIPMFTADRNTLVTELGLAMPYGTSTPIATAGIGVFGSSSGGYTQAFGRWDGTAWQVLAPSLPELCSIAARAYPGTPASAAPVIACTRAVSGGTDVVVYRLAP